MAKLYRYQAGQTDRTENRVIYTLKKQDSVDLVSFLAHELSPSVCALRQRNTVIVSIPRSQKAISHYGFDQSRELAIALSKETGIPYINALRRKKSGKMQKELKGKERLENASQLYLPARRVTLKGKRAIIVDDVLTTGATIVSAAAILRSMGARGISAAVVAVSHRFSNDSYIAFAHRERLHLKPKRTRKRKEAPQPHMTPPIPELSSEDEMLPF